jgi:hypothetical protein
MAIFKKPAEPNQQYNFEEQEKFQAPPEILAIPTPEELERNARKKRLWMFGSIALAGFTVVVIFAAYILSNLPNNETAPEPTPTPLPQPQPNELEKELTRLRGLVDEADPSLEPFAPPPVDMEVEF